MESSGSFNHDDSQWLFPATRAAEDTGSAATTRLVTTMNDRTDERFYVSSGGSISMQTAASQATASTEQRRRHSNRPSSRGGVEKIRGSKSRPSRSPGMLESVSAYGQASTPAPPGYRSHDSVDMDGSQSEVSVHTQELGPFLPGPYDLSQLNQPLEPFQMFGATGGNRANEWNTVTPASANVPFGDMQESMRAARSATPPSTFYTGPGSFETPDVPGRVHVMVRSWQNLQAEHSWYFQIEMDEFEIKFHHTPSTVKTAGMSSFKENWKNLEEYYLPILRIVIGDDHAFISQIPVFNRLLQTSDVPHRPGLACSPS